MKSIYVQFNKLMFGIASVMIPLVVALFAVFATAFVSGGFGVFYIVYFSCVLGLVLGVIAFIRKERHYWISVLGIALNLVLLSLGYPTRQRLSATEIGQRTSVRRLEELSHVVLKYRKEHGGASPQNLAKLLSEESDAGVFYVAKPETQRPNGWQTDSGLLEDKADYVLPLTPNPEVLIFERPGLWPDGSVAVGFSDGSAKRLSASEFKALGVKWRTPSGTTSPSQRPESVNPHP